MNKDIGDNLSTVIFASIVAIAIITITLTLGIYYGHKATVNAKVCREQPNVCIVQAKER